MGVIIRYKKITSNIEIYVSEKCRNNRSDYTRRDRARSDRIRLEFDDVVGGSRRRGSACDGAHRLVWPLCSTQYLDLRVQSR